MVLFAFITACLFYQDDQSTSDRVEYIRQLNLSNIQSFESGRVDFELIRADGAGRGDLDEKALTGGVKATGVLIFDGTNAFLSIIYDPKDVLKNSHENSDQTISQNYLSMFLLTDGESTLLDTPIAIPKEGILRNSPEVYQESGYSFFRSSARFLYPIGPIDIINNKLAEDLRQVKNGDAVLRKLKFTKVGENPSGLAELDILREQGFSRSYVIDMGRGAIPVQVRDFGPNGSLIGEILLDGLTQFKSGGWFPRTKRVNVPASQISEIFRATKIDFEHAPPADAFTVHFDGPTSFTDRVSSRFVRDAKEYSLIARKHRNPKDSVRVEVKNAIAIPAADSLPGELPPRPFLPWIVGGLFFGAILVYLALKASWYFHDIKR